MKWDLALETMSFQQQPWTVMDKMRNTMGVESTSWHMHSELRGIYPHLCIELYPGVYMGTW